MTQEQRIEALEQQVSDMQQQITSIQEAVICYQDLNQLNFNELRAAIVVCRKPINKYFVRSLPDFTDCHIHYVHSMRVKTNSCLTSRSSKINGNVCVERWFQVL